MACAARGLPANEPSAGSTDAHIRVSNAMAERLADVGIRAPFARFMATIRGNKTVEPAH